MSPSLLGVYYLVLSSLIRGGGEQHSRSHVKWRTWLKNRIFCLFSFSSFTIDFKICLYVRRFDKSRCPHNIFWLHFVNSTKLWENKICQINLNKKQMFHFLNQLEFTFLVYMQSVVLFPSPWKRHVFHTATANPHTKTEHMDFHNDLQRQYIYWQNLVSHFTSTESRANYARKLVSFKLQKRWSEAYLVYVESDSGSGNMSVCGRGFGVFNRAIRPSYGRGGSNVFVSWGYWKLKWH